MLQHAFARAGIAYRPAAVACTLEAFRLLEPLADNHRLQSLCDRHGIDLAGAHEAMADVLATAALLRARCSPRDSRPRRSSSTTRRTCGCARAATRDPRPSRRSGASSAWRGRPGCCGPTAASTASGSSRSSQRVAGTADVDALTRAQVQDVYDALEELIAQAASLPAAANG